MPDQSHGGVIEPLATYAIAERSAVLPEGVVHQAKRAIIDWHAAAYAGAGMPQTVAIERTLADELDCGRSSLVTGKTATVRAAAAALMSASAASSVGAEAPAMERAWSRLSVAPTSTTGGGALCACAIVAQDAAASMAAINRYIDGYPELKR